MEKNFYPLRVADVRAETNSAKSIYFNVSDQLRPVFKWRPGQHLTLRLTVGGEELRRSYSISTAPGSDSSLRITVKRVERGLVSNAINDTLKVGDTVHVMPPVGGFCLDRGANLRRTHYFIGAGSGITPLLAMIEAVLQEEQYSACHLVYGNANEDTIIFRDRLDQLASEFPQRLSVAHVLSQGSWWSGFKPWRTGKIDRGCLTAFIDAFPPYAQDTHYYICGPGNMNAEVRSALQGLDVPSGRIHSESFGGDVEVDDSVRGVASEARVTLRGQEHVVRVRENQTVLSAMREAGVEPPFSCESGVCGACRARLLDGEVHMRARMALEDDDVDAGAILTCQSLPTTESVIIRFD